MVSKRVRLAKIISKFYPRDCYPQKQNLWILACRAKKRVLSGCPVICLDKSAKISKRIRRQYTGPHSDVDANLFWHKDMAANCEMLCLPTTHFSPNKRPPVMSRSQARIQLEHRWSMVCLGIA